METEEPEANTEQTIEVGNYKRTIQKRPVTFTCPWCNITSTELHYPGNPPQWHRECKKEAYRADSAKRMKELRERRAEANPPRRGPGRPRKP